MAQAKVIEMRENKGENRQLSIAFGSHASSHSVRNKQMDWDEFVEELSTPIVTQETSYEYSQLSKLERGSVKDVGYFLGGMVKNGIRNGTNLSYRDLVCLDADFAPPDWENDLPNFAACFIHVTHSSTPKKPKLRFIFPLTRSVSEEEYALISRHLAKEVCLNWFDPSGYRYAQIMFLPSVSKDTDYWHKKVEAPWADPDTILNSYPDWTDVSCWPAADAEAKKALRGIKKANDPRKKENLIGTFCRVFSIEQAIEKFLPEVYEPGATPGRFTYLQGSTKNGAIVYEDGVFLYSHHGSDPCGGQLVNAFDMVRLHLYGSLDNDMPANTRINNYPSYREMIKLAQQDDQVRRQLTVDKIKEVQNDFAITEPTPKDDKDWMSKLEYTKAGAIRQSQKNLSLILENDKNFKKRAFFNEFSNTIVRSKQSHGFSDAWADVDDTDLQIDIDDRYGVEFTSTKITAGVQRLARKNTFHPVKEYLTQCMWDGVPRVERLFVDYLGCPETVYHLEAAKKFMAGAVSRALNPGDKWDYVPIIEGVQGIGKSRFWRILSNGWFSELHTVSYKEAAENIQGSWIIEFDELEAFNKQEVEAIKSFITKEYDKFRPAYGRHVVHYPRQSIFVGSTNKDEYLKDETGNRRFWPLIATAKRIDVDKLNACLGALWAEATDLYLFGEQLWLTDAAEKEAKVQQDARRPMDEWTGVIQEYLDSPGDSRRYEKGYVAGFESAKNAVPRDKVCILEVWIDALGGDHHSMRPIHRNRIRSIIRNTPGWKWSNNSVWFGKRFGAQRGAIKDLTD